MDNQKRIVILRTKSGTRYAHFIEKEINLSGFRCHSLTIDKIFKFLKKESCLPEDTLIHSRRALPGRVCRTVKELEKRGYRCINSYYSIYHTGDKFNSSILALKNNIPCPLTLKVDKKTVKREALKKIEEWGKIIIKPINSVEQGAYCFKFDKGNLKQVQQKIRQVPKKEFVIQQFVDYQRLYRVIVIGFKAIREAVFYDVPRNGWKTSVCLNEEIQVERRPPLELLKLSEKIARVFKSEVSFIDIFETRKGFVLNEINSACNLAIHERKSGVNISKKIADYLISRL